MTCSYAVRANEGPLFSCLLLCFGVHSGRKWQVRDLQELNLALRGSHAGPGGAQVQWSGLVCVYMLGNSRKLGDLPSRNVSRLE